MTWFRANRRRLTLFSALVLALQTFAVTIATGANAAAASAEGSNLVMICTANGVQMMDLSNPDAEPVPVNGEHQCPLCIVGCASCAAPALPLLMVAIAILVPAATEGVPEVQPGASPASPSLISKSTSPRGPPALA
jgi:hypothetical protein